MQRVARPVDTVPVILLIELKAPAAVCVIREPAPLAKPNPAYNGPCTNPSFGI